MSLLDVIKTGDAQEVGRLLDQDPSLAAGSTPEGVSYVSVALYHRQPAIAKAIARRKGQIDLYEACALGDRVRVQEFLDADPRAGNSYSPDGFTPIALAAFFGHPEVVEVLAQSGVDVNAQALNPMKVAAIHAAVAARDTRSVEILLRYGADPNLRQQGDVTPLNVAESNADSTIATLLREHGAR